MFFFLLFILVFSALLYAQNSDTSTIIHLPVTLKIRKSNGVVFYLLTGLLLLLAGLKFFFDRYFINLVKVFFNTSIRQNQLTDQLLQSKLPSLLFNLFFILSGGIYIHFVLLHKHWISSQNHWLYISLFVGIIGIIYLLKFCTLKFTGWITGFNEVTNNYIFITFLINKIMGIIIVPFIILITFTEEKIADTACTTSLIMICLLVGIRFFRSYKLVKDKLKIIPLHFLLYITGIELLPLLILYKGILIFLNKNL